MDGGVFSSEKKTNKTKTSPARGQTNSNEAAENGCRGGRTGWGGIKEYLIIGEFDDGNWAAALGFGAGRRGRRRPLVVRLSLLELLRMQRMLLATKVVAQRSSSSRRRRREECRSGSRVRWIRMVMGDRGARRRRRHGRRWRRNGYIAAVRHQTG